MEQIGGLQPKHLMLLRSCFFKSKSMQKHVDSACFFEPFQPKPGHSRFSPPLLQSPISPSTPRQQPSLYSTSAKCITANNYHSQRITQSSKQAERGNSTHQLLRFPRGVFGLTTTYLAPPSPTTFPCCFPPYINYLLLACCLLSIGLGAAAAVVG
jgi:hypothetical protein